MEVTLREFTEADAEALLSWASDTRVVLFQRHEVYARVDEARRYIRETGTTSCRTHGTAASASAARLWLHLRQARPRRGDRRATLVEGVLGIPRRARLLRHRDARGPGGGVSGFPGVAVAGAAGGRAAGGRQ
jgi:hypothetical protein